MALSLFQRGMAPSSSLLGRIYNSKHLLRPPSSSSPRKSPEMAFTPRRGGEEKSPVLMGGGEERGGGIEASGRVKRNKGWRRKGEKRGK